MSRPAIALAAFAVALLLPTNGCIVVKPVVGAGVAAGKTAGKAVGATAGAAANLVTGGDEEHKEPEPK